MTEQSLSDPTPPKQQPPPTLEAPPTGDPAGAAEPDTDFVPPPPTQQWTIEQILATARTPEQHARVSLRADLDAERNQIAAELATLVDARGEVIEDEDRELGQPSKASRAQELADRDAVLVAEQWKAMWFPLFRGLTSDELTDFNKLHKPKNDGADLSEYNTLLVAETSVASEHGPKLSVDDVRALRKKLGSRAMGTLVRTAHAVCTQGGADVPKSPALSPGQRQQ